MIIYSTPKNSKQITRWVAENKIFFLTKGIYTTYTEEAKIKEEIEAKLMEIFIHLKIEGVLSYDCALAHYTNSWPRDIWIAGKRAREVQIGPFNIHVLKGNETETNLYSTSLLPDSQLSVPSIYRMVLQNFSVRKKDEKRTDKNLALQFLIQNLQKNNKTDDWQVFTTNLITVAKNLSYEAEATEVIAALQKYQADHDFNNLDISRVQLFKNLSDKLKLKETDLTPLKPYVANNTAANENCAFFEAYFSNYIEGTEFEVEEAHSIIYDPSYKYSRHADGNDVVKTYRLILYNISNPIEIKTSGQYIEQIQKWHTDMFSHRTDSILVGQFKQLKNKAGSTRFVEPKLVRAMLVKSFDMAQEIKNPFARAIFLKVAFTEIHPFDDGNGRISRIILNNELSFHNQQRIMIPNVFRDDYMTALKAFSQSKNVLPIISAMNRAGLISCDIPYSLPFNELCEFLKNKAAFKDPSRGMWGVKPEEDYEEGPVQLDLFKISHPPTKRAP